VLELTLTFQNGLVTATVAGSQLTNPVSFESLPQISREENPYRYDPIGLGQRLFAALGGDVLLERLGADPDATLMLVTDEKTAKIPWEYAATTDGVQLAVDYAILRLLPGLRPAPPPKSDPLHFIILAADPLVDESGRPRTGRKLDISTELEAIEQKLRASRKAVIAHNIPPTADHLRSTLRRGPAILHISAHGNVMDIDHHGQIKHHATLYLEDGTGQAAPLRDDRLVRLPPPGVLRLVVFSACRTAASAMDAALARSVVLAGAPAAIGMQGDFPDPMSDEFAATLYEFLLEGYPLGEALRQARGAMARAP